MPHGRGRNWVTRVGLVTVAAVVVAGGYAAANRAALEARYAAYRLRTAAGAEEKVILAEWLVSFGEAAVPHVAAALRADDEATCDALATALSRRAIPELLADFGSFSPAGQSAALTLAETLLTHPDPPTADRGRSAVRTALTATAPAVRAHAAHIVARHPTSGLAADAVPLLGDADPAVRAAAMKAVGTAGAGVGPGDEELFRWLHDPDPTVRDTCEAVLAAHGRTAEEVAMGRRLTDPNPGERLQLLLDLAEQAGRDVGPWLERLARDPEPAVRAGAARVAVEVRLPFATWVDRLATDDPNPTVRQVARFYRGKAAGLTPAGGRE